MMYGYGSMMTPFFGMNGLFGTVFEIVLLIDFILLGVLIWFQIQNKR